MDINKFNGISGTIKSTINKIDGLDREYNYFYPNLLPRINELDLLVIINKFEKVNLVIGELKGLTDSIKNTSFFSRSYKRKEAVLSSKIEGTRISLEDVFFRETADKNTNDNKNHNFIEIINYMNCLDLGIQKISEGNKINKELLNEMHKILLNDTKGRKTIGEYKRVQNWIGYSKDINENEYIPPPPEEIDYLMERMFSFMSEDDKIPPLIKIGLMHYYFETIHPYEDGNGRLGRALIVLYLIQLQIIKEPLIYLSSFFEKNKEDYYQLLMKVRKEGDYTSWLIFFLEGVIQIARETSGKIKSLINLREKYESKLNESKSVKPMTFRLLDKFFENPVGTIPHFQKMFNKNYPMIKRSITHLEFAGIIREVTEQKRNKFYLATGILDIIEG